MILRVKGWTEFQHYKHRKPPWIRIYRKLLDDFEWHALPVASRALAPMLWLLASETQEGRIEGASTALAFRLHMASTDFEEALKPLISGGWFIESDPASILLAPCVQHATSEFRVQSTDSLTSSLTEPAREPAPDRSRSGSRAQRQTVKERMAALAAQHRSKFAGNA